MVFGSIVYLCYEPSILNVMSRRQKEINEEKCRTRVIIKSVFSLYIKNIANFGN